MQQYVIEILRSFIFNFKFNININSNRSYVQLCLSKDNLLHYEIILVNNKNFEVKVCLNFEGKWKDYFNEFTYLFLDNRFIINEKYYEVYIPVKSKNNIDDIKNALFLLIDKSYIKLVKYLYINTEYNEITPIYLK